MTKRERRLENALRDIRRITGGQVVSQWDAGWPGYELKRVWYRADRALRANAKAPHD
jgi:hypothetical protein